ncbi:MAG TPA: hypothetical protein VFM57_09405 [Thermoleophilaceae bacterium]|nr:hypothetical protein [Thermoleophilaceae bacterium]
MKTFALDVWYDLRAKRLWPVAIVLALALVAMPVVLSKPSEQSAPAPAEPTVRTAPDPDELKALASVKLDEAAERGSSLDTFDPSNPFRPPAKIAKRSAEDGASATVAGAPSTGGTGAPSGDTGSSGGDTGSIGGGGDTGSTGGGDTGSTGGGDTGSGGTPTTTQYRYVVDLTFKWNNRTRRVRGMERLDMLPSEESPLLLFLGVSPNAGNAVFLVDSTLDAAGEGRCKPRASECAFLYLGAGSEHEFTNDEGDSYTLRIDEIRKVRVGRAAAAGRRGKTASAAVGTPTEARRFASPLLSDLVSVSSGADADSNNHQDRR